MESSTNENNIGIAKINMNCLFVYIFIFAIIIIYFMNFYNSSAFENYTLLDENLSIDEKDKKYLEKFIEKGMVNLVSNNKIKNPLKTKNNILIITFDNRPEIPYIKAHNKNLEEYCKKWKMDYIFYDKCKENVYWCKIHMVLDALNNNKYDYVMWMDSDTYIFNMDLNLSNILNEYLSDIFIGLDNHYKYDLTNAGVFIVKNTNIGRQFLKDCIKSLNPKCIKEDGNLNGRWAGTCYEQGVMNILIADEYKDYTTVFPTDILLNYGNCYNDVFIMHLYGSSSDTRAKCFNSKNNLMKVVNN